MTQPCRRKETWNAGCSPVVDLEQTLQEGSVLLLNKCTAAVLRMENGESASVCECSWLYGKDLVVNDILHVSKTKRQPSPLFTYFQSKEVWRFILLPPTSPYFLGCGNKMMCILTRYMRWELEMVDLGFLALVCKQVRCGQQDDSAASSPVSYIILSFIGLNMTIPVICWFKINLCSVQI